MIRMMMMIIIIIINHHHHRQKCSDMGMDTALGWTLKMYWGCIKNAYGLSLESLPKMTYPSQCLWRDGGVFLMCKVYPPLYLWYTSGVFLGYILLVWSCFCPG
eukprot:6251450-Karenia_brevis.AAC.1